MDSERSSPRGICECGHAAADHLAGVGCCTDPDDNDCGCGVFRPDDGAHADDGMCVQITTADGLGTFRVRAAPDASPEVREALIAIAEEAWRRLGALPKKGAAGKGCST